MDHDPNSSPLPPPAQDDAVANQAAQFIAAMRPLHEELIQAVIGCMADRDCDIAAGDTYDESDYRESAEAAVHAVIEYLAWTNNAAGSTSVPPVDPANRHSKDTSETAHSVVDERALRLAAEAQLELLRDPWRQHELCNDGCVSGAAYNEASERILAVQKLCTDAQARQDTNVDVQRKYDGNPPPPWVRVPDVLAALRLN